MIKDTNRRFQQLISELHRGNHIDDMTQKWLCQTPGTPRTPIFYTLTKIHKPIPVGRPIISGCEGPTERLSSFVDKLIQPIAKQQISYLKDTTDFINFVERTTAPMGAFLVSTDVTSLYTNIPQEEGIQTICKDFDAFYKNKPLIPTNLLEIALRLILTENSFQFKGKDYLQIHDTAMDTKMAVAFANIFMAKIESEILNQSATKPLVWKRYIDDVISIWNTTREEITQYTLSKQTVTTPQLDLRLKYQKQKQPSWIRKYTKAKDSIEKLCLICVLTSSPLKLSNTHTSLRVSPLESKEDLSKERPLDC